MVSHNWQIKAPAWEQTIGTTAYSLKSASPYHGKSWEQVWPEIKGGQALDPAQAAADFYILEAMTAHVIIPGLRVPRVIIPNEAEDIKFFDAMGINDPVERREILESRDVVMRERIAADPAAPLALIATEAERLLDELIDLADPIFMAYTNMACAGEARHHPALRNISNEWVSGSRRQAWSDWRTIFEKLGPESLLELARLFRDFPKRGGYGGEKWAVPCEILYKRIMGTLGPNEAINKRMFVDRMWTLEHNGGCFLNKIGWKCDNPLGWGVGNMREVLNAHAANPTDFQVLMDLASEPVTQLVSTYLQTATKAAKVRGVPIGRWTEDYLSQAEGKILCLSCGSNPTIGHHVGCRYVQYDILAETNKVLNGETSPYVGKVPHTKKTRGRFNRYYNDPDDYGLSVSGKFKVANPKAITVRVKGHYASTGRGVVTFEKSYEMHSNDLLTKRVSFKQFGKKSGELGDVTALTYEISAAIGAWNTYSWGVEWTTFASYGSSDPFEVEAEFHKGFPLKDLHAKCLDNTVTV